MSHCSLPPEGNSRSVGSRQEGPHRDLAKLLRRHAEHPFRKPILDYNRRAFDQALAAWRGWRAGSPLILDAGCGVGWSTLRLAGEYPGHFVLGVDQSVDRLSRGKPRPLPANAAFVRADLVDFWRLLAEAGLAPARHYLLYPNPWPKIGHLSRRWPGHAVFPTIVALGGILECRSNWRIYLEELALALAFATGEHFAVQDWLPPAEPLTPFERKYLASGQALFRLVADLRGVGVAQGREGAGGS